MFSENSKLFVCFSRFCWALNCGIVVACTGAVFMRSLIFHEFFQKEADRCKAAIMWADKVFRAGVGPSWMIHHCALLQILQRPGEASFTDSLVARLNIGKPIMLASDASSWFACDQFYVQIFRINLVGSEKTCHPVFAPS